MRGAQKTVAVTAHENLVATSQGGGEMSRAEACMLAFVLLAGGCVAFYAGMTGATWPQWPNRGCPAQPAPKEAP